MFAKGRTSAAPRRDGEPGTRRRRGSSVRARRDRFVAEYLVDFNATQAAIRSGYGRSGAHVQGARLLKDPKVAAAIKGKRESILRELEVSAQRVIAELALIGFSNMADLLTIDEHGHPQAELAALDLCQAAAIQEVRATTETFVSKSGATRTVRRLTIRLADKSAALIALGKHLGLFGELDRTDFTNRLPTR